MKTLRRTVILGLVSGALLQGTAEAQQGALELFVGQTLFVGGSRASITWLHDESGALALDGSSVSNTEGLERDRDVVVASWATNLRRGLDLAVVLPFVRNDGRFPSLSGATNVDDTAGIGDLALVLKQRLHQSLWRRGAWNVSVIGGIETPTGDTSLRSNGRRNPPSFQAGSGSWDPFIGLATTVEQGRFKATAQLFYQTFSEGSQDFEAGDLFAAEFVTGYAVYRDQFPGPTLNLSGGLRFRHRERGAFDGVTALSSGGSELAVLARATFHPNPAWDVSIRVEKPVDVDFDGTQLESNLRLFFGLGYRF